MQSTVFLSYDHSAKPDTRECLDSPNPTRVLTFRVTDHGISKFLTVTGFGMEFICD
jgi:hypothetical protein